MSANDIQEGGSHYKDLGIEPWDIMEEWNREHFIGFLRFCILKRLGRWDTKDGALLDMKKARHELDKLIEVLEDEAVESDPEVMSLLMGTANEEMGLPHCHNRWESEKQIERGCNTCPHTLNCRPAKWR